MLCFAASFAPDAIPDELFRQPIGNYPTTLQPTVSGDASALDLRSALAGDLRVDEALGALDRLLLLAFLETSRTYSIHRLVQLATRDMVVEDALAWRECAIGVADAAFPEVEFATWPQCEWLLPHAQAALDALRDDVTFIRAAALADRCAEYLWRRADYGAAEALHTRTLAIREKAHGPDHPDVALSLHGLANVYYAQGGYGEAEPLYTRAGDSGEGARARSPQRCE